ncbi:hypothetical protein [Peterkaempfera griseoplana]|uniref:hypothetical protein n=1 Tax=Peterkaempfera griseoplana TaxID=66896 RepID=UPI0006E19B2F|nr:hypothetical protein [Peterkaempfera griseoplana]
MPGPAWVPPQPQPPKNRGKLAALGCGGILLLGLIIGGIASVAGNNSGDSTTATSSSSDSPAAGADDDTPTDSGADSSDTDQTPSGGTAADLYTWFTSGGQDHLNSIITDTSAISRSASTQDVQGVADGCTSLSTDVGDARSDTPIPDSEAQTHWAKALSIYQKAAAHCIAGASGMDADLLTQSTTEVVEATHELDAITARVKEIQDGS